MHPSFLETIRHFFVFCGVGAVNTLVSLALILLLSEGLDVHYLTANVIGYAVGLALGFVLHKSITFRATADHAPATQQIRLFLGVFAVAYACQFAALMALVDELGVNDAIAQILACGVYMVISFCGNRGLTFKGKGST